jgi:peptidoglycan/LPS O-acetylase OafA/YrhL
MFNFELIQSGKFRKDIQGIRALAVLAVIFCHFGALHSGFLGVDVFFVISGFLITGIIYKEIKTDSFSIVGFYIRRVRRIIPLMLFISLLAFCIGIVLMLPDDLENLSESVVATNFFSNNILQTLIITDYWDVRNEFKPLMHTWSLGVEEQYYLLYPLLFFFLGKKRLAWVVPITFLFAIVSFSMYLWADVPDYKRFYLITFRFWELAVGGISAILLGRDVIKHNYSSVLILALILLLSFEMSFLPKQLVMIAVVLITAALLVSANEYGRVSKLILENKLLVGLGTISFSLYMWHQLILAYARYAWVQDLQVIHLSVILVLTLFLSIISYLLIESPFRDKNRISTKNLFLILAVLFLVSTASAFYTYTKAGVLKDIPELGVKKSHIERGMHGKYNDKVHAYDVNFKSIDKIKVLLIGNSFARDWANVLLESNYASDIEISYIEHPDENLDIKERLVQSDVIFSAEADPNVIKEFGIPLDKLWVLGDKNFGTSNGIFYNYRGGDYYQQRTSIVSTTLENNKKQSAMWKTRYIDLIAKASDANNKVAIFSPSHEFISQDCRHFTQAGAKYYAQLFDGELKSIFAPLAKTKKNAE